MSPRSNPPRIVLEAHEDFRSIEIKVFSGNDPSVDPSEDEKVVLVCRQGHQELPVFRIKVRTRFLLALLGVLTGGGIFTDLSDFF
jgi:hypothetical protein